MSLALFLPFICFSLISNSIYLFNDIKDIESDRKHPVKKFRPLASGKLKKEHAYLYSILLLITSLTIGYLVNYHIFIVLILYFLIQVLYTLKLKNEPILDLVCISSGFTLRAIAGVIAVGVKCSPWFLLSVGLLAYFLAIEKRKSELKYCLASGAKTRKVLKRYSMNLLSRLENIVSSSCFVSYSLWSAGPLLNGAKTPWMLITVPFVLIGLFRYQLISDLEIYNSKEKEALKTLNCQSPEEILFNDKGIKLIVSVWLLSFLVINLLDNANILPEIFI